MVGIHRLLQLVGYRVIHPVINWVCYLHLELDLIHHTFPFLTRASAILWLRIGTHLRALIIMRASYLCSYLHSIRSVTSRLIHRYRGSLASREEKRNSRRSPWARSSKCSSKDVTVRYSKDCKSMTGKQWIMCIKYLSIALIFRRIC